MIIDEDNNDKKDDSIGNCVIGKDNDNSVNSNTIQNANIT